MHLRTLREGSHNNDGLVLALEEFLRDEGWYNVEADGVFDSETNFAVRQFQQEQGLPIDGVVGGGTWGKILGRGFHAVELEEDENWPSRPTFKPLSYAEREKYFGRIECRPAPTDGNPEGVVVTNGWVGKHIVEVGIPQLRYILGVPLQGKTVGRGPSNSMVQLHRVAVEPMVQLWKAWEANHLLGRIRTWAGMLCLRYTRGSRTTLSNHSYGTAFDINAPWNGLRKTPALKGAAGSVRELAAVAMTIDVDGWGWWWGGWGWPPNYDKFDGMHFELRRTR